VTQPILTIDGLSVSYGGVPVLEGASLVVQPREVVGLVGESGSGKTTLVLGALRLLPAPAEVVDGSVVLGGHDVLAMDAARLRLLWWEEVALVPQNALNALNPVLTIGAHFDDTLSAHGLTDAAERRRRAEAGMALVDLDPATLEVWPHMLSGGMRQRVAIALALVLQPRLVVFDEPTTALDVVVERDILDRIRALQRQRGFASLFITHDISLLRTLAHRVAVLYAGRLVEVCPVAQLGGPASHPYTQGLLAALPPALDEDRQARAIPGAPPQAGERPVGCAFAPRCAERGPDCGVAPELRERGPGHRVACHRRAPGGPRG
jgi:peptide/nickel transport system ATP-binding protein